MAAGDEPATEVETRDAPRSWEVGQSVVVRDARENKPAPSKIDWVKGLFGGFGRGAPA